MHLITLPTHSRWLKVVPQNRVALDTLSPSPSPSLSLSLTHSLTHSLGCPNSLPFSVSVFTRWFNLVVFMKDQDSRWPWRHVWRTVKRSHLVPSILTSHLAALTSGVQRNRGVERSIKEGPHLTQNTWMLSEKLAASFSLKFQFWPNFNIKTCRMPSLEHGTFVTM